MVPRRLMSALAPSLYRNSHMGVQRRLWSPREDCGMVKGDEAWGMLTAQGL